MRGLGHSLALVEGMDRNVDLGVFPQAFFCVFLCVEGIHEYQWHIHTECSVQNAERKRITEM